MFTLGFGFGNPTEIAIIAGVIVLLFGGAKIANFGKSMGESIREFKKATSEEEPKTDSNPPAAPATPAAPLLLTAPPNAGITQASENNTVAEYPVRRVVQRAKKNRSSS